MLAWTGTGAARGAPANPARFTADDLLIFELRLDRVALNDSFSAFAAGGRVVLPLAEFCRELDLAIQVDPARGVAEGFIIAENRKFRLDVKAGTYTVQGTTRSFDPAMVDQRSDDLYLDTRLLAQCLPLDIAVDTRAAAITVTPREPLPLQLRWAREGEGGLLRQEGGRPSYPPMADPYRLFEFPAVDASLGLVASGSGDSRTLSGQGSLVAAGDLLYMSTTSYALMQDPGGLTDYHLTMGRRDPHGGLLGPLRATEFGFGEVLDPGLNLMASPSNGTGALFSNHPLQTGNAFDRHSFQGDLPPGWQVELYQNNSLIHFQNSRPDGLYQFLNVPLFFGPNDFRLVFYGPQGQRRVEAVRFDVSESQVPAGTFYYHLVSLQPRGLPGRRDQVQASYGLTGQLTALAGSSRLTLADGIGHTYSEAGLQGFWKPLSASLTAGGDDRGGSVGELALRTRLGPVSLVGKQTELAHGFTSEVFQSAFGSILDRTTLETSAALPSLERPWFTLDLGGYRDRLEAGGEASTLNTRLSTALGRLFLSNQTTSTAAHGVAQAQSVPGTGSFLASRVFPGFSLRAQAGYTIGPARRLDSLGLDLDTSWAPFTVQGSVTRNVANRDTTLQVAVDKSQGAYGLGLQLGYSTQSRLTAGFTLRFGLSRDPVEHHYYARAQGMANFGAVSAQAFLDSNGNGVRDPGEKPQPDLGFLVGGNKHPRLTDNGGVVFLDGLTPDVDTSVAVAPSTLEDPLMRPERSGVRLTARPGHVARLAVPIVVFGEINGTGYQLKSGQKLPLAGLRLELRDGGGRVVKSLLTAFDGFYTFSDLPPGSYQLSVAEAAAGRLGAAPPPVRTLTLAPEGSILDGVDFILDLPDGDPQAETAKPGGPENKLNNYTEVRPGRSGAGAAVDDDKALPVDPGTGPAGGPPASLPGRSVHYPIGQLYHYQQLRFSRARRPERRHHDPGREPHPGRHPQRQPPGPHALVRRPGLPGSLHHHRRPGRQLDRHPRRFGNHHPHPDGVQPAEDHDGELQQRDAGADLSPEVPRRPREQQHHDPAPVLRLHGERQDGQPEPGGDLHRDPHPDREGHDQQQVHLPGLRHRDQGGPHPHLADQERRSGLRGGVPEHRGRHRGDGPHRRAHPHRSHRHRPQAGRPGQLHRRRQHRRRLQRHPAAGDAADPADRPGHQHARGRLRQLPLRQRHPGQHRPPDPDRRRHPARQPQPGRR